MLQQGSRLGEHYRGRGDVFKYMGGKKAVKLVRVLRRGDRTFHVTDDCYPKPGFCVGAARRRDFKRNDIKACVLQLKAPVTPRAAEIKKSCIRGDAKLQQNIDVVAIIFFGT